MFRRKDTLNFKWIAHLRVCFFDKKALFDETKY